VSPLDPERTPCPHCGRNTQTASDGVCAECWGDKRKKPPYAPGKGPEPEPPRARRGSGGSVLDDLFYWFEDSCCLLPALVIGATAIAVGRLYQNRR